MLAAWLKGWNCQFIGASCCQCNILVQSEMSQQMMGDYNYLVKLVKLAIHKVCNSRLFKAYFQKVDETVAAYNYRCFIPVLWSRLDLLNPTFFFFSLDI